MVSEAPKLTTPYVFLSCDWTRLTSNLFLFHISKHSKSYEQRFRLIFKRYSGTSSFRKKKKGKIYLQITSNFTSFQYRRIIFLVFGKIIWSKFLKIIKFKLIFYFNLKILWCESYFKLTRYIHCTIVKMPTTIFHSISLSISRIEHPKVDKNLQTDCNYTCLIHFLSKLRRIDETRK